MNLSEIQRSLRDASLEGWLFCDFHHRDPMAYKILGLDARQMTTRRWFYYVPASGDPVKLAHKVEPRKLDALPGEQQHYLPYTELHEKLKAILSGGGKVAMQYSPMNNIPYVSVVDAGTVELVRSFGVEVVSSADLIQKFEAVTDADGLQSHRDAGDKVLKIKDEAYATMDDALRKGQRITEYDVREFILKRFAEEGMTADGSIPIVGFNDHPADPHFEPIEEGAYALHHGDTILLDLWARNVEPAGLYYDVTWCGFAGSNPPALYEEIWRTVTTARDAGLDYVRRAFEAGRSIHGHEVDDVVRQIVDRAGFGGVFVHRTGHSIGVDDVHGNGANIDNLETKDDRMIVPGTCFSIEPGIYLEGRMAVRTEIDVIITTDGKVDVHGPIQEELICVG